ncbi:MAG TPA: MYXO-CTERM sorting domain-containing protein, partial [Vicinamibacterales bacterium]|nr:MYXO-CTERM sorting domain-containing protein [Vicinamibacterales bacterium]
LADGILPHTDPFDVPTQSFQVTLPSDVTCTACTLQVLQFMQADTGGNGVCFYHHCANVSIGDAPPDGGSDGGASGGCACAAGGTPTSRLGWGALLTALAVAGLRRRRALLAVPLILSPVLGALGGGCGGDRAAAGGFAVSPGDVEHAWLERVGSGPAQTAVACARGGGDPVAGALCATPAPALAGLADLYRALGVGPDSGGLAAVATHSLGLSARTVSALNPRVVAFPRYSPLYTDRIAAAAFSRGEPFVEMVGYDAAANDFNFYLLAFQPACGADCAPADLLTDRLESGWTGWTLYADRDLEDTPLDCSSCHHPDGARGAAPRRLLMRQIDGPWMHWGDFRGVTAPTACTDASGATTIVDGAIAGDGADLLRQIDGPAGWHGGVAVADLVAAPSGYDLSSFIYYAAGQADGPGDVPCLAPDCAFSEPDPFPSEQILCDRLLTGRADGAGGAWNRHRAGVRARGLPAPYFDPDVLDATARATVAADFAGFVASAAGGDAFTRLSGLIAPGAARAIGFVPDDDAAADVLLRTMCARCHDGRAAAGLARSRFDATALDRLDAAGAAEVVRRILLPRTSPDRMPPLRSGELPGSAVARLSDFLSTR